MRYIVIATSLKFRYNWVNCDINCLYGLGTAPDDTCRHDSKLVEVNLSECGVESDTESYKREP